MNKLTFIIEKEKVLEYGHLQAEDIVGEQRLKEPG